MTQSPEITYTIPVHGYVGLSHEVVAFGKGFHLPFVHQILFCRNAPLLAQHWLELKRHSKDGTVVSFQTPVLELGDPYKIYLFDKTQQQPIVQEKEVIFQVEPLQSPSIAIQVSNAATYDEELLKTLDAIERTSTYIK